MTNTIDPVIFDFLRGIMANNNKPWFDAHRALYDQARSSLLSFGEFFIKMVQDVDPSVGNVDVKNCIYRINRDLRFSPDKRPYKHHMALFVANGGKCSRLPGYYLHIEPGHCLFATGNYGLTSPELKRLRTEVSNFPEELAAIVENPDFTRRLRLDDQDNLKSLPRGFSIEPRYANYLKFKTLSAHVVYSDDDVLSPRFASMLQHDVSLGQPLNAFFSRALSTEVDEDLSI